MLNRNRLSEFNFRERFDRVLPPDDELTYDIWLEMMGGIAPGAGGYSERYHMEVHGPHSVNGPSAPRPVESAGIERVENDRSPLEIPTDEVSISPAARMLEQLVNDPDIRAKRSRRFAPRSMRASTKLPRNCGSLSTACSPVSIRRKADVCSNCCGNRPSPRR